MCECGGHSRPISTCQTLDELDFERGLWFAAQYGDLDRTLHLLKKGTYVDQRDSSGYTPLHYAARNGHLELCRLLVEEGACVNAITNQGQATALHRAAAAGKSNIVKFLLEQKANCRLKDADGKNALHRAATNNSIDICQYLLNVDTDLKNEVDDRGKKPVDYAQNTDLIALLH